jgi:hypothetical protein
VIPRAASAVTPSPTYGASTLVAQTPHQTLTYGITLTKSGTLSYLILSLPSGSRVSAPRAVSSTGPGSLELIPGGFIFRLSKPLSLSAGTRLSIMVSGITTPPAGTYAVLIRAKSTSGAFLAYGWTAARQFTAPVPCPTAWPKSYIRTENSRTGTTAWRLAASTTAIAGYASKVSARCGDVVTMRVDSTTSKLAVVAYRMGYYAGQGSRAIWASRSPVLGVNQPQPLVITKDAQGRTINMVTARNWGPTLSMRIDGRFTPGDYLLKVTDLSGRGSYVPLTVRADGGPHDYLVLNSVSTWQTYNAFGGMSGYTDPPNRSWRISYDRPFAKRQGTGSFLNEEYGWVYWAEKQGLDMAYAADIDMHGHAEFLDQVTTLVVLTHAEYVSVPARTSIDTAVARGLNLVHLGGNGFFWRINPVSSPLTGSDREHEIFRTGYTGRFRDDPDPNPEQNLLGAMFGCMLVDGTTRPNATWLWQGVVAKGLPHLPYGEVDEVKENFPSPRGAQILTTTPLTTCYNLSGNELRSDIMGVDDGQGGRVFSASTQAWVCSLIGQCYWNWSVTPEMSVAIGQATRNVLAWVTSGTSPGTAPSGSPETAAYDRLRAYQQQHIEHVRPLSSMPPLEPPDEDPHDEGR